MGNVLYLAADHRGYGLKEEAESYARERGLDVVDVTPSLVEGDDYPDIAAKLVDAMRGADGARGILACGSGTGMAIAANRFEGIRAVLGMNPTHVAVSRHDDDVNVLVLSADFSDPTGIRGMIDALVDAPFASQEERYVRRRDALDQLG